MLTTRRVLQGQLRAIREDRGMTYRDLAAAMKKLDSQPASYAYLCKIERSHIDAENVSPRYLLRVAAALGVDLDAISTREPVRDAA
jgi:transcriptional regulator with XRE-family HTH domain